MAEPEEKRGGLKIILGLIFFVIVIGLLVFYWIIPFNSIDFGSSGNSNFNPGNSSEGMQFYENMRYSDSGISYKIYNCPLKKKNDMEEAFAILENKTILEFYEVSSEEEISVTCDSKVKMQESLFIAGEGGPVNITKAGSFNVILRGKVLLFRDSECANPNVAIHELLHALGFKHSSNSENIMYNFSNCRQTIGDDIIDFINEVYSIESLPDLVLEEVSASARGIYMNTNVSVKNNGLRNADGSSVEIYVDGKHVKSLDVPGLRIGEGVFIGLKNLRVSDLKIENLKFVLDYSSPELDKKNNEIELKLVD
jgi:hypothetical protein